MGVGGGGVATTAPAEGAGLCSFCSFSFQNANAALDCVLWTGTVVVDVDVDGAGVLLVVSSVELAVSSTSIGWGGTSVGASASCSAAGPATAGFREKKPKTIVDVLNERYRALSAVIWPRGQKVTDNLYSPNIPEMSLVTYRVVIVTSQSKQGFPHLGLVLWVIRGILLVYSAPNEIEKVRMLCFRLTGYSIKSRTNLNPDTDPDYRNIRPLD